MPSYFAGYACEIGLRAERRGVDDPGRSTRITILSAAAARELHQRIGPDGLRQGA